MQCVSQCQQKVSSRKDIFKTKTCKQSKPVFPCSVQVQIVLQCQMTERKKLVSNSASWKKSVEMKLVVLWKVFIFNALICLTFLLICTQGSK